MFSVSARVSRSLPKITKRNYSQVIVPRVDAFWHAPSFNWTYLVTDPNTNACAIIDPVLDYDPNKFSTSTKSADNIVNVIKERGLETVWIMDTHCHADHISASSYLKGVLGGKVAIGHRIQQIQKTFCKLFNVPPSFLDGADFDVYLKEGDTISLGSIQGKAIETPGHTPACMTYEFGNSLFVGDTIFMPDYGCSRCDFPDGSAAELYDSVQRLYSYPDDTRVFLNHDYLPATRSTYSCETTIKEEKEGNILIRGDTGRDEFISMRQKKDATLAPPKMILPSLYLNLRAGKLPPPEPETGLVYLKLPLNLWEKKE
eukprot:TRINITY_DN2744_c0_g1_i1.p1 TRINITY_DN2744_c0_g1~~TRINITY_DN2744_c0_g1_i1.p1  ORF type:complete len:315 (+),score=41.46 TRINITY_DN2744_c0_g1_i1:78-1022(+)